ncbi:MAG: hypothetical protein NTU61_03680, partial [Candidatus Altiarchaeota archaeon]|nr:hypothetical protein [Candidatus Altiarchaeota archaeon]
WIVFNVTNFGLNPNEAIAVTANVTVPVLVVPVSYINTVKVESSTAYAEAKLRINVVGTACGDTVIQTGESCETRNPFIFPDANNPSCANSLPFICDEANHRYGIRDAYGDCVDGCVCQQDAYQYAICGDGCTDANYCNNCFHCTDNVMNCGEIAVDAGGGCRICDGVNDTQEGSPCNLGQTSSCGTGDCAGTKSCVVDASSPGGIAYCKWVNCSTMNVNCPNLKCCKCTNDAVSPSPNYDGTQNSRCTPGGDSGYYCYDVPNCDGGNFRGECVGINQCSADTDQSTWPVQRNDSTCNGQTCGTSTSNCYDSIYVCHGNRTDYKCGSSACQGTTVEDANACSGLTSCNPPATVTLHRMELNGIKYIEGLHSQAIGCDVRGYPTCWGSVLTTMENNETTYYFPYRDGTLKFWTRGEHYDPGIYDCGDNVDIWVRIGTNSGNYAEYRSTTVVRWSSWYQKSIDLRNPTVVVGTVDWNNINYLLLGYYTGYPAGNGCTMNWDYFTIDKR